MRSAAILLIFNRLTCTSHTVTCIGMEMLRNVRDCTVHPLNKQLGHVPHAYALSAHVRVKCYVNNMASHLPIFVPMNGSEQSKHEHVAKLLYYNLVYNT